MFLSIWKQVISAIAYTFTTFEDDYTVQRAVRGLQDCATLAGSFDLPEVIDFIVISLSQSSGLIPESLVTSTPTYPIVKVEDQDVTVSTLSVKFGTNFKGQLAAVVLFVIANTSANAIREGWTYVGIIRFIALMFLVDISLFADLRNLSKLILAFTTPFPCGTNGGLPRWSLRDSVER